VHRRDRIIVKIMVLLFVLWAGITTAQTTDATLRGLDEYIEKARQDWEIPGVAVGIVKDDALIFAKGYGVREIGKKAKVDEHTLFAVASNTKAFTASMLGMLVDEDKLEWDDRVIDYIDDLQLYDPYVTREISVRDLLTHRSGLPTFGGDHLWIGAPENSREEIMARLRFLKPTAPFRTRYQYQNLMFMVAGQIIPEITGKSWDDFIRERIFEPLGMNESNSSILVLPEEDNVATPHEVVDGKHVPIAYDNVNGIAPAGGINSNVVDMAQWMRLHLGGGVYEGRQILSHEVIRDAHSIQFPLPVSDFNEDHFGTRFSGYGLGWSISDYRGYKMISHGGGLSGMISLQTLIPEKSLGVIVLTNFAPNSLTRAVTYRILDAFLGEPEQDWSGVYLERRKQAEIREQKNEEELLAQRVKGTRPSLPMKDYAGRYFDELSGEAEVRMENGNLVFDYNPRHIGDLEHWHHDTFRVTWRHPIFDMAPKSFLTFYLDERGKVATLRIHFYDPIYFQHVTEKER